MRHRTKIGAGGSWLTGYILISVAALNRNKRVLLWKSKEVVTSVTGLNLSDYNTLYIKTTMGDYYHTIEDFKDSDAHSYTLSAFHSVSYYVYGRLKVNWETGSITADVTTSAGGWGSQSICPVEVWGAVT